MLQNPSRCRHHSKWVFPSWRQAVCCGWFGWKREANGEWRGKLETEWQVNTCQPHGRSRCWSPGLSHLTTYGADGEWWSLTWTDRPSWANMRWKASEYIYLFTFSTEILERGCPISQVFPSFSSTSQNVHLSTCVVWKTTHQLTQNLFICLFSCAVIAEYTFFLNHLDSSDSPGTSLLRTNVFGCSVSYRRLDIAEFDLLINTLPTSSIKQVSVFMKLLWDTTRQDRQRGFLF